MPDHLKSIRCTTFNIEGGASRHGSPTKRGTAQNVINNLSSYLANTEISQAVWLPEAFSHDHENSNPEDHRPIRADDTIAMMKRIGDRKWPFLQEVFYGSQSVKTGSPYPYGVFMLSRNPDDVQTLMLGDYRNAVRVNLGDLAIYGIHFDHMSEKKRLEMSQDLLDDIRKITSQKKVKNIIVMGDYNATHSAGLTPWLIRNVGAVLRPLQYVKWKMPREISRLPEICKGDVLRFLTTTNFRDEEVCDTLCDADPSRRATESWRRHGLLDKIPARPVLQLDHILHSSGLKAMNIKVHPDGGSDHRAVSATIQVL